MWSTQILIAIMSSHFVFPMIFFKRTFLCSLHFANHNHGNDWRRRTLQYRVLSLPFVLKFQRVELHQQTLQLFYQWPWHCITWPSNTHTGCSAIAGVPKQKLRYIPNLLGSSCCTRWRGTSVAASTVSSWGWDTSLGRLPSPFRLRFRETFPRVVSFV